MQMHAHVFKVIIQVTINKTLISFMCPLDYFFFIQQADFFYTLSSSQ